MQKKTLPVSSSKKGKHLTLRDRYTIENLLNEGCSIRYISERINKPHSTVWREIKRHTYLVSTRMNDCANKSSCTKRHACGNLSCKNKCKLCNVCKKYCTEYKKATCALLSEQGTLCNGCYKKSLCNYDRILYRAEAAHKQYRELLVNRRSGFDLTGEELEIINQLVSPLIKQGLSPYHIKQTLNEKLPISECTLRRLIDKNELDIRNIDLKEKVKRKPRKQKSVYTEEHISPARIGHLYTDYLDYINLHDVSTVQMDCVEGSQTSHCVLLTLHFVIAHMQLAFLLDEHTSSCVVEALDKIEISLGSKLFSDMFPVILCDNGHEFMDIEGMEQSIYGGQRCKIFYCEPNRPDQKGAAEVNHRQIRCIIPKGTSFDHLMQKDITLLTNHINSYKRKSLLDQSPYDVAMRIYPEDFFILLGLCKIEPDKIILKPELVFKNSTSQ